jgi:hypothetical protein
MKKGASNSVNALIELRHAVIYAIFKMIDEYEERSK